MIDFDLVAVLDLADGVDGIDPGVGAVDLPLLVGHGLDQVLFGGAYGVKGLKEALGMAFAGFLLLFGADVDLPGKAVARGIQAGALLAFGSARASAFL